MMVTFISSFVFAGVLSAYIFLGRGLSRQVNEEDLESRTRLALFWFNQDVSLSSAIIAQNPGTRVTGTMMSLTIPSVGSTVYYACNWAGGTGNGVLTRQVGVGPVLKLLTHLTSFSFGYYDSAGNTIAAPTTATSAAIDIKQAYMAFTTTEGVASTGNQSNLTVVSPRVTLKNKGILTDPTTP
jgi:hypothetical protein